MRNYKIAVAGTGYVGLSIATLLSQHHKVTAVDIIPEKVDMINNRKSPIQDDYIEKYLAELRYICGRGCDQAGHGVQPGCHHGHQVHHSGWLHCKHKREI